MIFRNLRNASVLLVLLLWVLPEQASAWPLGRSSRSSRYSTQRYPTYRYGTSGGSLRVAPKTDPDSASYRPLQAVYRYDLASQDRLAFGDRIRVFLSVYDRQVLQAEQPLVAEVKISDLSDAQAVQTRYIPLSWNDGEQPEAKLAVFDVGNQEGQQPLVAPGKVYRLFVNLHVAGPQYDAQSALGRVTTPYYTATGGATRLERARRHVVMRAFKEFYGKEKGWRSREPYRMDCVAFYRWAAGSCTVDAQGGHANLGRLFGGITPMRNGSAVSSIAREEPIHGDYVRISGHSFMLLAHDQQQNQTWTIEGNFNQTIEVTVRSANSGWSVGHLAEAHLAPDAFQVAADSPSPPPRPTAVETRDEPAYD